MKRGIIFALAMIALVAGAAFAQNRVSINIQCSELGAQVYINDHMAGTTTPNFTILVPAGPYQVRVTKQGFQSFETVIRAGSYPISLNVVLQPVGRFASPDNQPPAILMAPQIFQSSITINSNVAGAQVTINGNPAGQTPFSQQVPPGTYNLLVQAPGYLDFNQSVVVNGPTQVNAVLQGQNAQLSVDSSNFRGAQVILNGNMVGQTPFNSILPPGAYSLTVRAPGFADYTVQLNLNGPQSVVAVLVPMAATWRIFLPDALVNRDLRGRHWSQIQIFLDGVPQRANGDQAMTGGQLLPGHHTIRVVSGGLAAETGFDVQAGGTYTIEPFMGLNVK